MPEKTQAELDAEAQQAAFMALLRSPEYLAALRQESELRDTAFLELPETVCGFKLRPLTARDLLTLTILRSPFLASDFISGTLTPSALPITRSMAAIMPSPFFVPAHEIAKFLWLQSLEFEKLTSWRARWRWKRFMRRVRSVKYGEGCEAIRKYLSEALADKPGGAKSCSESFTSWIASFVHLFARQYRMQPRETLALPLKILWQYQRQIMLENDGRAGLSNATSRMRVKFLNDCNARRRHDS